MILDAIISGIIVIGPQAKAAMIPAAWQPFAACVSQRESNNRYDARNRSSSASGRWQFLDRAWRVNGGIEWIVSRQLKRYGMSWSQRRGWVARLEQTSIHRWPTWAQDAAFVGVVTERPTGWKHWRAPGSRCNRLVPA